MAKKPKKTRPAILKNLKLIRTIRENTKDWDAPEYGLKERVKRFFNIDV